MVCLKQQYGGFQVTCRDVVSLLTLTERGPL